MPNLLPLIAGSAVAAALCLLMLLVRKRQRAERHRLTQRIVTLQRKIDAALQDENLTAARESFSASLKAASLTTELQRPRLDSMAKIEKQPPEKYRILGKLAAQGMDAEEIAAILGISRVEAGQLLSLRSMAECGR